MGHMTNLLSTEGIISCRIRFAREHSKNAEAAVITKFFEPQPYVAVKEHVPIEQWLTNENQVNASEGFHFLFLPDALSTMDLRRETEAWLDKINGMAETPAVELVATPNRIIWHRHRVVVLGEKNVSEEAFMALVEFGFFESELRKLESKLQDYFAICPRDICLTHGVGSSDLRRQAHVNKMTQQITSSRMEFLRLIPCFDKLYGRLTPHTKPIIGELTKKTRVWNDRIEAVDDQLEFLEDLYELANDRLTEFKYFRGESTLELWIIALLVLELAVMLWEASLLVFHSP